MKKVALVGFSRTTRGLAPFDDPDVEIWGLNEGYVRPFPRITRWFQLHSYQSFTRADNHNDPDHYKWLQNARGFPIYMQRKYKEIPSSVAYPLNKIKEKFGHDDVIYATSSFSYMILLAMLEGFDWIGVYGFEMATGTEYFHQRPNAEYLIGMARGMKIQVDVPDTSNLLRGRMYAYEDDSIGLRQLLEYRKAMLEGQFKDINEKFFESRGRSAMIQEIVAGRVEPTMENLQKEQQIMIDNSALANTINGARKEVDLMFKVYDGHNGIKALEDMENDEEEKPTAED